MAKLFMITEGLENLGALKTGGQGSVYKGKRLGEIYTAIKLLPTPIHSESIEDKNYRDFANEVAKLKKVNEQPNPHVVRILNSGITDTGNFPFIEMEYIEGPDLEELLKPPHEKLFTISESLKVAEQLSSALAHCHRVQVKHGDIKSNNVKLNVHTGNYVLLDFGMAVMSDEQRRTSLRHAGAIEFMAPEQNRGEMLFQTDVYSFGIVLFELLAGTVPFPLHQKGETARNHVMVAHMETPVPDLLSLRKQNLPAAWSEEKKRREMQVPPELVATIYKCLQKNPADRYANGELLHENILSQRLQKQSWESVSVASIDNKADVLLKEKAALQQKWHNSEKEVQVLRKTLAEKEAAFLEAQRPTIVRRGISPGLFLLTLLLTAFGSAFVVYMATSDNQVAASRSPVINSTQERSVTESHDSALDTGYSYQPPVQMPAATDTLVNTKVEEDPMIFDTASSVSTDTAMKAPDSLATVKYKVRSKAFFHDEPDEATRRNAFILHWNNAVLQPLAERNGFIYVVYTNDSGQTSKGWLAKTDLLRVEQ
jgi:serine/threonine-protein kinase